MTYHTELNILSETSDELALKRRVNRKTWAVFYLLLLLVSSWLVVIMIESFQSTNVWRGLLLFSIVISFLVYWNIKNAKDWEEIRFSKPENTLLLEGSIIGKISEISSVRIFEFQDSEDGYNFMVVLQFEKLVFVVVRDSDVIKVKDVAQKIANWCNIQFEFISTEEKMDLNLQNVEIDTLQKEKEIYLKKWKLKTDEELLEIYAEKEKYTAPVIAAVEGLLKERKLKL